jgi:predicted TPR repeat methyltransferase
MASARLLPEDPVGHARELIEQGRAAEAALLLQSLIGEGRGGLLARVTLVDALIESGDAARAVGAGREAASLNSNVAMAVLAFGRALIAADALPAAIAEIQRALRLDPDSVEARYQLGLAWLKAGEPEKALAEFGEIPSDRRPSALQETIAEAEAMRAAPRSNANYVQHLFDQFSADYDTRMIGQLGYRAPAILRELFDLTVGRRELSVLDLGCGTGLGGAAFKDIAGRLDGIDLSPRMIAQARARGLYDSLAVADIETALAQGSVYDLILAADTLVYLGDLANVFAVAARRLATDRHFLFTVERKDGEGFELGPKRRWRHAQSYLRAEAERAGFDVAGLVECVPRYEAGEPVPGYAVALRKKGET